jgi:hypothetical protein
MFDEPATKPWAPVLAFLAGAMVLGGAAVYLDAHPAESPTTAALILLAGFLVVAAVAAPFVLLSMRRIRERHLDQSREELESIEEAAHHIRDQALARLVCFNFRLMDRFVSVALVQAKAAYLFCAVSAGAALLVLLTGATALLSAKTPLTQISVGVLSAAGAGLSGFISVTFMRTFRMTSRQMSYYYGQPLVHCYLLHAEWLAERHRGAPSPYDEMLIQSTLDASRNAQYHLLELLDGHLRAGDHEPPGDAEEGANGVHGVGVDVAASGVSAPRL